jgi:hypothetical protein
MKRILTTYIPAILGITLFACTKHHDDIEENIPVAFINFFSPTQGAVLQRGDSVNVKGIAISTETIHGYDIYIREVADTASLYVKHVHHHNDTLMIDHKWEGSPDKPMNLEAEITLYLDHDGHIKKEKQRFRIQ